MFQDTTIYEELTQDIKQYITKPETKLVYDWLFRHDFGFVNCYPHHDNWTAVMNAIVEIKSNHVGILLTQINLTNEFPERLRDQYLLVFGSTGSTVKFAVQCWMDEAKQLEHFDPDNIQYRIRQIH